MDSANGPAQPVTIHVKSIISTGLSTDGTHAARMYEAADGQRFMLAVPVEMLGAEEAEVRDLRLQAIARGASSFVRPLMVNEFEVFDDDRHRNIVMIMANPKSRFESLWAIPDQGAVKCAQLIMRNLAKRMRSIVVPGG